MTNKFFLLLIGFLFITTFSCSSDDDNTSSGPINVIIEGANIAPQIGGPNQQNQVYIDLSTNTTTSVQRDSWDLAFYSGSEFRVAINGSIYMAAGELTASDIDAVNSTTAEVQALQPQVAVGTFNPASIDFVDAPDGDINGTAIKTISDNEVSNHVYLLNLGYTVGTNPPANGTVAVTGDERGWMKIRVLKNGNDYVLQYADLNATTHQEILISKSANYNFTFFSFNTQSVVNVEPVKSNWDLNFTVFTNEVFAGSDSYGAYGYSDFVVNNSKANAKVYMVDSNIDTDLNYDIFTLADVIDSNFTSDQRGIGSSWRNGGGPSSEPSLKENVFYVVHDTDGNLYKLKFWALTNDSGERGHPEFVYSLLQ